MNEKEERWESDNLNHIPFGYGCIYNSAIHLTFNIFMFRRMKVCFGTEFFGDVGIVEYDWNYYRNNRNRYGWLNDNPLDSIDSQLLKLGFFFFNNILLYITYFILLLKVVGYFIFYSYSNFTYTIVIYVISSICH